MNCEQFDHQKLSIEIWLTPITTATVSVASRYINILSDHERRNWQRLRLRPDRNRYLVSHVLLRLALSRVANQDVVPKLWRFTELVNTKPRIAASHGLPLLNFSLSQADGLAAVAISPSIQLGIDVEPLDQNIETHVGDTVLTATEKMLLESRNHTTKDSDFIRIWTVKEAYAKLLGLGHTLDFTSFEVCLDPTRLVWTQTDLAQPNQVYLNSCEVQMSDKAYQLSLAADASSVDMSRKVIPRVRMHLLDAAFVEQRCDEWMRIAQTSALGSYISSNIRKRQQCSW